jgi:hypothetical protein
MFSQRVCGRKAKPDRRLGRDRTQLRQSLRYDQRVRQDSGRGFHNRQDRR